jgi:putative SOS response-associated peptidase YedK
MCARFTLTAPARQVAALFDVNLFSELTPRYNIAPTQNALAVRLNAGGAREAVSLRWGLVPAWANDLAIGNKLLNARSETVAEKPSFRGAFKKRRRCLIPADGFYEWRPEGKKRKPFRICPVDGGLFALAGLWESWTGTDNVVETCTILTTAANEQMSALHDRMPVLFTETAEFERWLSDDDVATLMRPLPEGKLRVYAVNDIVNNARHEDPRCVEPAEPEASLFD